MSATDDGDRHVDLASPTPVDDAPRQRRRSRRPLVWLAGALAVLLLLLLGGQIANIWPRWANPFAQEETDRSQPPLLQSIRDLSRYVAAEGNFQVVIDLERNRRYVPEFLLNERTLLVGAGRVEAFVDFSKIADGAVTESADRRTVTVRLPAPELGEA